MFNSSICLAPRAGFAHRPTQAPVDRAGLAVALLLAALFTAAILAALHPAQAVEPLQAAVAGGL